MRVASYDPAALESQIGPRGATTVNSANRALVQNWLVASGVPSARAKAMRLSSLWKCYNRPRYLVAVLSHIEGREVDPSVALPEDDEAREDALNGYPGLGAADDEAAAAVTTPAVAAVPYPAAGDAASQLAGLIQTLAAGAINEQRVIELIREHAPLRVVEQIVIDRGFERVPLGRQVLPTGRIDRGLGSMGISLSRLPRLS